MNDKYVILPTHPWFETKAWSQAGSLQEGFEYTSKNNTEWLTHDQLREMASSFVV
jgi:hypothetical protein